MWVAARLTPAHSAPSPSAFSASLREPRSYSTSLSLRCAGSPGGAGPLFATFAQAAPEEWSFPVEPAVLSLDVTAVGTPVVDVVINGTIDPS